MRSRYDGDDVFYLFFQKQKCLLLYRFNDNYLFESLNKIGLVKRLDAQLRLWVNTGTVNVTVNPTSNTDTPYILKPANNTFSNTCPLMVNYLPGYLPGLIPYGY